MDFKNTSIEKDIKVDAYRSTYFSDLIYIDDTNVIETNFICVNTGDIVGTFKDQFDNLTLGEVATKNLHKNNNVKLYESKNSFESYLQSKKYSELPIILTKIDEYYYVSGDGNHRTAIAKLVGIKYINAIVNEVKQDEEIRIMELINNVRKDSI